MRIILTSEQLLDIIKNGETHSIECKKSEGGLSNDLWETYSAFANTNGGIILLRIEEKKGEFNLSGVKSKGLLKTFWDTINNSNKVSANILKNSDIQVIQIEDKEVIEINVPRANRRERPVFIGTNPLNGTFRRNHEGDYKCTQDEVKRMLADQSDISQDSMILENFNIRDINVESLKSYKARFSSRNTTHPWLGLDDEDFLYKIGGIKEIRETGKRHLTLAGLLMFGEESSITEVIPQYFLDYREKGDETPGERWRHRIISSEGTWSGNIYDFFFKIINRLTEDIDIPFKLKDFVRQDATEVHEAIREALVNTLVHADYFGDRGIVVEKEKLLFSFSNPGNMRVPIKQALMGGTSDPRNPTLLKMFSLLGIGERAGSGLEIIQNAWKEQYWIKPQLLESVQPDRTTLLLKRISFLPKESLDYIKKSLNDSYKLLNKNELLALVTAHHDKFVTNTRMQELTDKSSSEVNRILNTLVSNDYLISDGSGRGMKYMLADMFINNKKEDEIGTLRQKSGTPDKSSVLRNIAPGQ